MLLFLFILSAYGCFLFKFFLEFFYFLLLLQLLAFLIVYLILQLLYFTTRFYLNLHQSHNLILIPSLIILITSCSINYLTIIFAIIFHDFITHYLNLIYLTITYPLQNVVHIIDINHLDSLYILVFFLSGSLVIV